MQTIVDLKPEAYRLAERLALQQHRSVADAVSEFLIAQLGDPVVIERIEKDDAGFPILHLNRRITSEDVARLIEEE